MTAANAFGVYVHIPFCTRRCDYCAFATWTDRFHLANDYVDSCVRQMAGMRSGGGVPPATSVFFGGGTPSLLDPGQLAAILASMEMAAGAEVTVECNPETVDGPKLRAYRAAGVTRISFGVQSMVPHVLQGLGRAHRVDSVLRAVDAAGSAGLGHNYSVDLIFGAAGESLGDWERSLQSVLSLDPGPAHVSAYALSVEAGTPLAQDRHRHPDADDQADKYLLANSLLGDHGYRWYEISNWARPGSECIHNQLYWSQGEYLGVGCAAHSHRVDSVSGFARRWWNVRTPDRFIRLVSQGLSVEAAGEELDPVRRRSERLELELRTSRGVPQEFLPGWNEDPDLAGLVEASGEGRVALTPRGRLLGNEVALRLDAQGLGGRDSTNRTPMIRSATKNPAPESAANTGLT